MIFYLLKVKIKKSIYHIQLQDSMFTSNVGMFCLIVLLPCFKCEEWKLLEPTTYIDYKCKQISDNVTHCSTIMIMIYDYFH